MPPKLSIDRAALSGATDKAKVRTLLEAAALHRRMLRGPTFVGVTGSCGKSTTVTLAAHVLRAAGGVHDGAVVDTTNDDLRVALSVLHTKPSDAHVVVELTGHKEGALDYAAGRMRIGVAVVTHIRADHYTNFRDLHKTAQEKGKIVDVLGSDGFAILNTDDELVWNMRHRTSATVIGCGRSPEAELRLVDVRARWPERLELDVEWRGQRATLATNLVGEVGEFPVLAAAAIGLTAGLDLETIAASLAEVEPVPGRLDPYRTGGGVHLLDDAWKAPEYSFEEAGRFLGEAVAERKVMVIGTISDTPGKKSKVYRRVTRKALEVADVVVVVGPWADSLVGLQADVGADRLVTFETTQQLNGWLRENGRAGDLVMLRGSGRMDHFERLAHDDRQAITCWTQTCRRPLRCEACTELRAVAE